MLFISLNTCTHNNKRVVTHAQNPSKIRCRMQPDKIISVLFPPQIHLVFLNI